MKTRRKPRIQKLSVQRLTRIATRRRNTDKCWDAIAELQLRGSPQTLELARNLYKASSWRRRAVGMYIASQMWRRERGRYEKYAIDSSHELLFAGLRDHHPAVIQAAATGFLHRHHDGALDDLVRLARHASDNVR